MELLAACLACWAPATPPALRPELGLGPAATDVDDATLEKLAEFAGRQGVAESRPGLGLGELIDVAGEAGLSPTACLRLCERLLADSSSGGGGSLGAGGVLDATTWARQKAVLLKCAVPPFSLTLSAHKPPLQARTCRIHVCSTWL